MSKVNNSMRRKRRRCMRMDEDCVSDNGNISWSSDAVFCEVERFGFEPGPEFTLDKFQKYADDFKAQYFRRKENDVDMKGKMTILSENYEPSVENIEGEYWRIVEKATEEIEGAPKIWYGVPGKDAPKLEEAMKKHLPDLFDEQPDLLYKLATQLSHSILKSEGVPVYRCVMNAEEFVFTFLRAYYAGFNCGFNCAEAVNVAPVDWLPHGQIAIELYREQGRKTSISHDKLLLGAAREAVKAHRELSLLKKYISDNLRWKSLCGQDKLYFW